MSEQVRRMTLGWLEMHHGDREALARWMRRNLRMGIRDAREAISEALGEASR